MQPAPDTASPDATELDRGPGTKPGAERMCAVSRQVRAIDDMIRFVVGPDGAVVPDLKHKLPGRGLWVTAQREALEQAVKRKVFSRGFKREVAIGPDFVAGTDRMLVRSATDALAIAAKAGEVVSGFAKVEEALAAGRVAALIHATEAATDGVRKLAAARHAGQAAAKDRDGPEPAAPVVINALSGAELDLALGRSNVIHAALLAGPAGKTFLARAARLVRFREPAMARTAAHADTRNKLSSDGD